MLVKKANLFDALVLFSLCNLDLEKCYPDSEIVSPVVCG